MLFAAHPPNGSHDRDGAAGQSPERGNGTGAREDVGCLRIEREPPDEQFPGRVHLDVEQIEPRRTERSLVSQYRGGPLGAGHKATIVSTSAETMLAKRSGG
jgi:hypothetical protein